MSRAVAPFNLQLSTARHAVPLVEFRCAARYRGGQCGRLLAVVYDVRDWWTPGNGVWARAVVIRTWNGGGYNARDGARPDWVQDHDLAQPKEYPTSCRRHGGHILAPGLVAGEVAMTQRGYPRRVVRVVPDSWQGMSRRADGS